MSEYSIRDDIITDDIITDDIRRKVKFWATYLKDITPGKFIITSSQLKEEPTKEKPLHRFSRMITIKEVSE